MPIMDIDEHLWRKVVVEEEMTKHDHEQQIAEAYQAGYNDAYFDGLYLVGELPCKCGKCSKAYDEGQKQGIADLLAGK